MSTTPPDYDVAIIGAGAAGVGAARRLAGTGLTVVVLEASARVGGRAWTVDIAGMHIDLGCGWLHSADRNSWTAIAEQLGFAVDRRKPAWRTQYRDLGFTPEEQAAASKAFADWSERLVTQPSPTDCAADALPPDEEWRAYLQAMSGFISGAALEQISVADYLAYDQATTGNNWRLPDGYGALVSHSLPSSVDLRLSMPVTGIEPTPGGVRISTRRGTLSARSAIVTASTAVLTGGGIDLSRDLESWTTAASLLPLGSDEKVYLEIVGDDAPFAPESHVLGDPRDENTGVYYIRPLGLPVIECFLGDGGARVVAEQGQDVAFARAIDQLVALFGSDIRRHLRPLVASNWQRMPHIGGAYSHALPGHAAARRDLARPFDGCIYFAGEATNPTDFSTAHGAHDSGARAADEVVAALVKGT